MSVTRIGYASINVKALDEAIEHYSDIVGLRLIERTNDRAYLQAHDAQDHHCLILNAKGRAGLDHLGYKVDDPADLEVVSNGLRARGIEPKHVAPNIISGQGAAIRFTTPSGHDLLLYYHADKVGYGTGMRNPDSVSPMPRTGTTHLDHAVLSCESPKALAAFMQDLLGFYVTEQANAPDGEPLAIFLSCGSKMHDLAIAPGPPGAFHHLAFGVESRVDVITRTDVLKQRHVPTLELGVTRHGISGVTTVYFLDPAGNRNEFCHGAYLAGGAHGRVPPILWPAETAARALFYYEGAVPGAFLSTVT
jgi:catechol 2,3-dioxygenase